MRDKLWQEYYDQLSEGIDSGYSPDTEFYDEDLALQLKENIAEFSSFKETSFRKQLEAMLTEDGDFLPWSKFREKAMSVSGDYNKRWLKTEYHQTVASANMAGKWKSFEANKDLYPNLKYVDAGDDRVREKHRQWDGTILPLNHPWWDSHYPPSDWGCRCDAVPTDEDPTVEVPEGEVKKGFDNNSGKTGKVFTDIAYQDGLSDEEIAEATKRANQLFLQATKKKK